MTDVTYMFKKMMYVLYREGKMSSYKETAEEKRWRERLEYLHNLKKVDDMLHPQKDKDDLKN